MKKNVFLGLAVGASLLFSANSFAQFARVQIIHNSADAVASEVDVYLNGTLLLNDVAFRTASPFIDAPAGVPLQIDIAPGTSTSVANSIGTFNYTLVNGEKYVIVADGIVSSMGYTPGNTGASAFDLKVYNMGQEAAMALTNTDVLIHHGATDAPAVDVVETSVPAGAILTNASYGDFSNYLPLATADYRLEVRATGSSSAVASYEAPLQTLGLEDSAIVVVASGFLDPSMNSNGPAFGLFAALPSGGALIELPQSTARVQIIHNSSDDIADSVDVYLNGNLLLDNLAYRNATAFIDAPAGSEIQIDIAPKTSTSVANSIYNLPVTLTPNETYVVIADGITGLSSTTYSPSTPFALNIFNMGQEAAGLSTDTDVLVYHGSTDAPAVDVYESSVPAGNIVTNASFSEFAGYLPLTTADYRLEVRATGSTSAVASYEAPLQTLGLNGAAITVLASGFLDPSVNGNGPAFGLFVALATGGELVALPQSMARVQIIHNSSDDIADSVDVYLNGNLLLDNLAYRNATAFIDAPAGSEINIDVAPKNSTSVGNSIANFPLTLVANETYIVVADGITGLSSTTYTPAPAFDLAIFSMGREVADVATNTDVLVYHGSTDAPAVDVVETSVPAGTIVTNASFGDFSGYLDLATLNYTLDVRPTGSSNTVASYSAPLQTLGLDGAAITVLASGFLDPSVNGNGPAFGLFAASAMGGELLPLPLAISTSLIENSINSINVYPNPAIDQITIEGSSNLTGNIIDQSGKVVLSFISNKVDISELSKGVYFINILDNETISTQKLIKQ